MKRRHRDPGHTLRATCAVIDPWPIQMAPKVSARGVLDVMRRNERVIADAAVGERAPTLGLAELACESLDAPTQAATPAVEPPNDRSDD